MIDHLCHIEDLILDQGPVGAMKINNHLWSIQQGGAALSTKWDGAPSIFAGWIDDEFFVSTKSYLNKGGAVTYNLDNIESADIATGLKIKLRHCLRLLPDVIPKGMILQGDLLFTPGEVFATPEYPDLWMCHPNTLVYGFPNKWWEGWEMAVAWHTWIDKNGNQSHPPFGKLLSNDKVLAIDPHIHQYSIDEDITTSPARSFDAIDMEYLESVTSDPTIVKLIKRAYNSRIRDGAAFMHSSWLYTYVRDELTASVEKLKTERGRMRRRAAKNGILDVLREFDKMDAILMFQDDVRVSKLKVINSLDTDSKVQTFVSKDDGLHPAAHEGYVVFGQSETLKLVNRSQFSYHNFSSNIHKGWDAPTRT